MSYSMFVINTNKTILIKSLQCFTLLRTKVNVAPKKKTLYETLGVGPNATYNEIKSAYYALTLKYHPDKNKSESAKIMFQEISNAYDILSKYQTRTEYDRTLRIKYHNLHGQKQMKQKQSENIYKYTQQMKNIYDFDTWLEDHYSYTFKQKMKVKAEQRKVEVETDTSILISVFVLFSLITMIVYGRYMYQTIKERTEPSLKIVKKKE